MTLRQKLKSQILSACPLAGKLAKDNRGVAAIEFAFIAPIMIAMYFGMTELAMAITADRNVSHATSISGDLSTQLPVMNSAEISDVMTATIAVLGISPEKNSEVTIELNSYQMESDGTVNQVGYARLGPPIAAGGPPTYDPSGLNSQMFNAQSGVVVARINYKYTPTTFMFMENITLSETFIMKPRKSISVPFDEGGVSDFTCNIAADQKVSCAQSGGTAV